MPSTKPMTNAAVVALLLATGAVHAQSEADDDAEIEEVVVTGTQIKGASIADALAVSVLDADDIDALGIDDGADLLEQLVEQGQNYFSEAENISGGVNSARGDIGAYNLRNLGTGNTLVLLNGRRLVNAASYQTEEVGGSFVPVNTVNSQSLPPTAISRVEVLRDGASAIYGADAVAGVVNYVLKRDFEGTRLRVKYADFENTPRNDLTLSVEWGRGFNAGRSNVGVYAKVYQRDRVNSQDDPRWADSDLRWRLDPDSPWAEGTVFRNNSSNSSYRQYDLVASARSVGLRNVLTDGPESSKRIPPDTSAASTTSALGPAVPSTARERTATTSTRTATSSRNSPAPTSTHTWTTPSTTASRARPSSPRTSPLPTPSAILPHRSRR